MGKPFPGGAAVRFLQVQSIEAMERGQGAAEDEPQRFRVAVSSEYEVTRDGFLGRWREVLDHSPDAVDMGRFSSGAAAVLVDHSGDQVGVVESARLDADRVLRATVRFSANPRGQEVQRDVLDGIRKNISVGYLPHRARLVAEDRERGDLWRVTSWTPVELSFVSVPADPTVGVGRGIGGGTFPPVKVEVSMSEHAAEVAELAAAYGMAGRAAEWIREGRSADQVRQAILEARATPAPTSAQPSSESLEDLGLNGRDVQRYSYRRALAVAAGIEHGGLEAETSRELERHLPAEVKRRGGVLVPLALQKRNLSTAVAAKGAEVAGQVMGDLIQLLRNRTAVIELGATVLTGLTAPVTFPKQTGAMTAYWVGENPASDVTASDVAFALALLAPKTLQAATAYSRQLLLQSSLDVEGMVRDDLAAIHARAIDYAAIHGLGAAGEPTGIYKATGVNVTSRSGGAGAFRYSDAMAMVAQVAGANADLRRGGWVMHPTMAANLMQVARFSNTDTPVWEGNIYDGKVAGLRAVSSAQVSKTMATDSSERTGGSQYGVIVGDWADLIVATWGALEVVVDPYTSKKKGLIEVASFQMADVLARHGESFSKGTNFTG